MGFMDLLVKARLVEPSEDEKTENTSHPELESLNPGSNSATAKTTVPKTPTAKFDKLTHQKNSFDQVYKQASVPSSNYSAEKLIRLLDGLKAMDANTRKVAIAAMDAADETWTIQDPIDDAQQKIGALQSFQLAIANRVAVAEKQNSEKIQSINTRVEQATQEIKTQIKQLEELLNREMTKAQEDIAAANTHLRNTQIQAQQQVVEIDEEIAKFSEVIAAFASPQTASDSK